MSEIQGPWFQVRDSCRKCMGSGQVPNAASLRTAIAPDPGPVPRVRRDR